MCPAEGDSLSLGAAKDLAAGPVSLPPGSKAGNILPLMVSDSYLNHIESFEEKCRYEGGLRNRFHKKK